MNSGPVEKYNQGDFKSSLTTGESSLEKLPPVFSTLIKLFKSPDIVYSKSNSVGPISNFSKNRSVFG